MSEYDNIENRDERIKFLRNKLMDNPVWALRGLKRIYALQTADEQVVGCTSHQNGVGFNAYDAELLTSFAKQVESGRGLSLNQLDWLCRKMPKYARQLDDIAQAIKAKREPVQLELDLG